MRNLIRSPLTWMVVAELIVVAALIVVVWKVIGATNDASRSRKWAERGSSQSYSRCETKPETSTRSSGPSPTT